MHLLHTSIQCKVFISMERKHRGPGLGKRGHFKRKMEMGGTLFLFLFTSLEVSEEALAC